MDNELMKSAENAYLKNFKPTACFERAIFFSWYCSIGDCAFCYMSTQPKGNAKKAVRSVESLLAEAILCKKLGWDIGFLSGGCNAYTLEGFNDLLSKLHEVLGEKIWINVGVVSKDNLKRFSPYIKGVVGSVETINLKIHDKVCPSKPIKPIEKMFDDAEELKIAKAMTIILGLGETIDDFGLLKSFIKRHNITKIHFYGLNPQKGTIFEKSKPPSDEYQAEWIARTRIEFPKIDIQCGIWEDRVDRVGLLLKAGANSVSKFPALRKFNSKPAKEIESQAKSAGRKFTGTLTKLPAIDIDKEVDILDLDDILKKKVKEKLKRYINKMKKNRCSL
jgi:biotin synthase-like enzyme